MVQSNEPTADSLVAEHVRLDDWVKAETKWFGEHLKGAKDRLSEIEDQLQAFMLQQKIDSVRADSGTAYISTIMNLKIEDREKYLDFVNENWDTYGNEMLLASVQKDATKHYMQDHAGAPPPGVTIGWFQRVNVRRT
jgi:hypothetical protein